MATDGRYMHFYVNEKQTKKLVKCYDLIELLYGEKKCVILTVEIMNQNMHKENMNIVGPRLISDVVNLRKIPRC
jgi:hypothetical protein